MLDPAATEIGGLDVPDAGLVFLVALGVHVIAGAVGVVAGVVAAFSPKRRGRHPVAGTVFLYAIGGVFVTATVMTAIRWEHNAHLFAVAVVTGSLALSGFWVRRRRPRRWLAGHGALMSGAYIGLLTGFYVDNGPRLPLWDQLPPIAFWFLPAAVGIPIAWVALRRNRAVRPLGRYVCAGSGAVSRAASWRRTPGRGR